MKITGRRAGAANKAGCSKKYIKCIKWSSGVRCGAVEGGGGGGEGVGGGDGNRGFSGSARGSVYPLKSLSFCLSGRAVVGDY